LPCDFALYCERNLVERFFSKPKHFRAIATRYDKLVRIFSCRRPLGFGYDPAQLKTGSSLGDLYLPLLLSTTPRYTGRTGPY
jgi:hypothetical protein